jgi:diketogulonate reductase-like aldo/keto reductase
MIACLERGYTRSIGVSNFGIHHLQDLIRHFDVIPAVNQIEVSPYLQRRELVTFCEQHQMFMVN